MSGRRLSMICRELHAEEVGCSGERQMSFPSDEVETRRCLTFHSMHICIPLIFSSIN